MTTLDKDADDQNWDTVGRRKRLTVDSGARIHGVAHVDTGDVANRYDPDPARKWVEEGSGGPPPAPPRNRDPRDFDVITTPSSK